MLVDILAITLDTVLMVVPVVYKNLIIDLNIDPFIDFSSLTYFQDKK